MPGIDRDQITRILAWTSVPANWRMMTPRHWRRLGWLMLRAVPDEAEAREEIRQAHPGWADQADAAAAEAFGMTDLGIPGYDRVILDPDFTAECALRGQVLRVLAGLAGGCLTACPHASVETPRPIFAAAWGDRVDCRRCVTTHQQPDPTPLQARTCDLCGRVGRKPTILATPQVGMLTIGMGVCPDCVIRLALNTPGVAHRDRPGAD